VSIPVVSGATSELALHRIPVEQYLNLESVREQLGVDRHVKHYEMSSHLVFRAFTAALDLSHQTYYYVANLLERGIRVLNVTPSFRTELISVCGNA